MGSKSAIATLALVRDTFREAFARKIFWGFFGCSTAVILFFIFLVLFVVSLVAGQFRRGGS